MDGLTDGRTDTQGNNMSPDPEGGDIIALTRFLSCHIVSFQDYFCVIQLRFCLNFSIKSPFQIMKAALT